MPFQPVLHQSLDGERGRVVVRTSGVERRRAVVAAAFDEIARSGLEGLRMWSVAALVGLDQSTLHYYFPTKNDLVADVVAYATAGLKTTLDEGDGDPVAGLRAHLRATAGAIRAQPELFVVLGELSLRARRDADVAAIIEENDRGWRSYLAVRLAAATRVCTPEAGVELIIAATRCAAVDPGAAVTALADVERLLLPDRTGSEETT